METKGTRPTLLYLDEADIRRLRRLAFKRFEAAGGRMSVSALVREAIKDYLRKEVKRSRIAPMKRGTGGES